MKALSACLYCAKKKDCVQSTGANSFMDICFVPEDKAARESVKNLQFAVRLALPSDIWDKCNRVAYEIVKHEDDIRKLARKLITDGCVAVCAHGGPCPYDAADNVECLTCEDPCPCKDCFDGEKIKIDWSRVEG